jgi:hypothetical protein
MSEPTGFDIALEQFPQGGETAWDMLPVPQEARRLPMPPRRVPVPKPKPPIIFKKLPSYKELILLNPYIGDLIKNEAFNAAKAAKDKLNDIGNEIQYRRSNICDALINEAANRHLSKQ